MGGGGTRGGIMGPGRGGDRLRSSRVLCANWQVPVASKGQWPAMKYLQSFVKRFCSKAALSAAPDDAAAAAAAAASAGEIWGGGASPGGGRGGGQAWGEAPTSAKDPAGCCAARRAAASASGSETERANPNAVAASRGARNSSFECANWQVLVAA